MCAHGAIFLCSPGQSHSEQLAKRPGGHARVTTPVPATPVGVCAHAISAQSITLGLRFTISTYSPRDLRGISIGDRIRGFLWIGQFYGWDSIRSFTIVRDSIFASVLIKSYIRIGSHILCVRLNTTFYY